jgi:hypothetical protein
MGAAASGRAPRNEDDSESEDATEKVAKSMAITRMVKAAMKPTKLAKVQPTQLLSRKKKLRKLSSNFETVRLDFAE